MTVMEKTKWTIERLVEIGQDEAFELGKDLPAVDINELDGEYAGYVPTGTDEELRKRVDEIQFNESSVKGYWLGKAYKALSATKGAGYNHWRRLGGKVERSIQFTTEIRTSYIDGKPSLMMKYSPFNNRNAPSDLTDEIRKLDDGLYIGAATTKLPDDTRTAPDLFILTGPIGKWVGVDDEEAELK